MLLRRSTPRSIPPGSFVLAAVPALFLLAGCGEGESQRGDPLDPGSPVPAALTIAAGDQQEAPGGAEVAVPPTVRVADAGGQPVPGVRVVFAVVEGGGVIAGATQTTNATGIARVDGWTLGADGPQRIEARIPGVSPVLFEARIPPGSELIEGSVSPGGGTVAITKVGHPFEGLELVIPPGSFGGMASFRFQAEAAPQGLELPEGYAVRGPVLEIQTDVGRSTALMTLEVPVTRHAGEDVVLAMLDPATGAIEVMPTVGQSETSVTVLTGHLNAALLAGGSSEASPQSTPARQPLTLGSVAKLIPISLLTPLPPARTPLNAWPVPDHGSAAYPDGHGVAIPALQSAFPAGLSERLSGLVRTLDTPGFYAEAGPLAAVQIAHQRLSPEAEGAAAEMMAALAPLSRPQRAELMVRNIVASMALNGRSMPVAVRDGTGPFAFLTALGGSDASLQMRPATTASELEMLRNASTGLEPIEFPQVAGGPSMQADEVVPLSSFVFPREQLSDLVDRLRQFADATTPSSREPLNRSLAQQAGLPDVSILTNVFGDSWTPVADELVVRSPNVRVRVQAGRFGSFTLHLPEGAEIARTTEEDPMTLGGLAEIQGQAPMESIRHVLSVFVETLSGSKQVIPLPLDIVRARFELEPETLELEFPTAPATLEATVDLPPEEGFRIHWDWGDGATSENLGLLSATHEYEEIGEYQVIATLQTVGGDVMARDTATVRIGNDVWVGDVTYTSTLLTGPWNQVVRVTGITFDKSESDDPDLSRYFVAGGEVEGRITTASGSGCPYDSGPVRSILLPGSGQLQTFQDSEHQGEGPPPLEYQAIGNFQTPLVIPIQDTCDSGDTFEYRVYLWLSTNAGEGDGLAWIPSPDPNLLEGSYTTQTGSIRRSWEWRFEKRLVTPGTRR